MKVKLIIYSNLKKYVKNYDNKEGIVLNKAVPSNQLGSNLKGGDVVKVYPPMGGG